MQFTSALRSVPCSETELDSGTSQRDTDLQVTQREGDESQRRVWKARVFSMQLKGEQELLA